MQVYAIYAPAHHKPGKIQKRVRRTGMTSLRNGPCSLLSRDPTNTDDCSPLAP
jgi:hypothetical protein